MLVTRKGETRDETSFLSRVNFARAIVSRCAHAGRDGGVKGDDARGTRSKELESIAERISRGSGAFRGRAFALVSAVNERRDKAVLGVGKFGSGIASKKFAGVRGLHRWGSAAAAAAAATSNEQQQQQQ